MITISNYQILTQIYESINSIVFRAIRVADEQPVILKMLKEDYPDPEVLSQYRQEYDITRQLEHLKGVVRAYSLEKYQQTLVMCLEDFGGESLKMGLAQQAFTLEKFLQLAIQIADILGQIHQQHIIHKDINPSNLIWSSTTQQLKIIDFGISTSFSRENPRLKNPNQLEGTLAYISPEQTGRMNRALDYRTDLYSLGVTFYELLTGNVPFESEDPLELVHCHIAKFPTPISQIDSSVPAIVSDIVMKLMAKNVEDRYQSAFGLQGDLKKCLENLEGLGNLQDFSFQLAQNDFSGQFQISQKLYGRDQEVNTLLQAFERIASPKSKSELMLVAGYAGVGKTALVHEVHKPMTSKHGHFAAGKFDQYQHNIPYSAFTTAFNQLCHYLLSETPAQLQQWRERIVTAVGNNGQILIDVIPQLELIIGPQMAVAEVDPQEAQNRFNLVLQNFMQVICQPEHPLVLFIDDWQWADSASLSLLKNLLTNPQMQSCLIIGAYRDNEVDASHPLTMTVGELNKANVTVNQITLANLSYPHVNTLISEALDCEPNYTQPLAELVYAKTYGNAFFTTEFLKSLYEEALLAFDFVSKQWQWNLDKIASKGITDNVVELMASKIGKLAPETRNVLTLAACIGNTFDLKTLSVIAQQQLLETLTPLLQALEEGLLVPLDDHYKHWENLDNDKANSHFKFQHDRVQQAAYSLIADTDKQAIHLCIARLLLANSTETTLDKKLFDIVNQYNEGRQLLDNRDEQLQLAELNLKAGKKAKDATAYLAAQQYLKTGIAFLNKDSWQSHYSLSFGLYKQLAEVEYLNGHFAESEQLIHTTLTQAQSVLEQAELYYLLVTQHIQKAQYEEVIPISRKALALLGLNLPEDANLPMALEIELAELKKNLDNKNLALLLAEPATYHSQSKIIANLLWKLAEACYGTGSETLLLFIFAKVASISFQYGQVPESSLSYFSYGMLKALYGEYKFGYEFAMLGLKLSQKFKNSSHQCIICESMVGNIIFWVKPLKYVDDLFRKGYQAGLESGTLSQTSYLLFHQSLSLFYQGENIENVLTKISSFRVFAQKNQLGIAVDVISTLGFILWNLSSRSTGKWHFHNDEVNETQYFASCQDNIVICFFQILKSQVLYLYDKPDEALQCALEAEKLLGYIAGLYPTTEHNFYHSLNLVALYPSVSETEQQQYWEQLETNQAQMKSWADNCPENFLHKYLLVAAEMARVAGKLEAIELYDQAIVSAGENEFIQNEALGNELAAKFWLAKGKKEFAQIYLKKAHHGYQLWGAKRKVEDLEQKYPQFFTKKISGVSIQSTITAKTSQTVTSSGSTTQPLAPSTWLDMNSVIKASQTLSGEIVLSKLLDKMMQIVIENAGAEKGFLLLPQEDKWFIEAEGYIGNPDITVLQSIVMENSQQVAEMIIHYVARTQQSVVLDKASEEGQFTRDPYIVKQSPKSVLCAPLVNQGQLTGILYLENNLTTGAFTPDRLEILQVLSSQVAISIENALLYQTLEQKVEQRTAQLAQANKEITALNKQLKSDNIRLSAELEVSKQLQQMLLPTEEELIGIDNLDIAGFMEPADEVGGDYYDVFYHDGHIICGIGDVTGHGLESGALAMMVQSVVRALTIHNETDPVKFLNTLNRTIYHNVLRMKSDKSLTFSLLSYKDNLLHVTGQHEEIIVVKNGHLERIDTFNLGFPIGLEQDIAEWVTQKSLSLNSGDVVVLYTDGITEAINSDEVEYQLERLCQIVEQNWQRSAMEIRQAVINDVQQYIGSQKVFDDITLLVLKQKPD